MDTPICDFVKAYAESGKLRLHMPGHKGCGSLGVESLDITEISGADSLYEASGIIAKSEANASHLFGCPTFFSTEGASQCIRAMLYLCLLRAKSEGKRPVIAAGRNAHKILLSAAALLDFEIRWLYPECEGNYLSCPITPDALNRTLSEMNEKPVAVYLTSPDYLGHMLPIAQLAQVAHDHGCLLAVDNAHGAYLKFLPESLHPMDLGADLCCSSAHKTLPVLTGGAYLHTSPALAGQAKNALALFGSTSPSYLILQSLDQANKILAEDYSEALSATAKAVSQLKTRLNGYTFLGDEPMKLTIAAKHYGYTGTQLAQHLARSGIEWEFSDPDFLTLMVSPETGADGLKRLEKALAAIPCRTPLAEPPPRLFKPKSVLSIREALLSPWETIPVENSLGRILATPSVGCPPAVPIVVCGEEIDEAALQCFHYYGIQTCSVVK